MKNCLVYVLIFLLGTTLLANPELFGPYDSMAGAGVCKTNSNNYINLFLSQRGILFKIDSNSVDNKSGQPEIQHVQIKGEGKYYCWAAFTTLTVKDKTLSFASCGDNKVCFTDNILSKEPDLKIIADIYDSSQRPIRIEQIAAVDYQKKIYLFVMSADHEIYQGIFNKESDSKVFFSKLKYKKDAIYATSLNAIINSNNKPVVYIKQAGMDKAGSLLEYNFITKQGRVLKNINGSRILVVQSDGKRVIYYGAGLVLRNTFNDNSIFKVDSSLGSYIPVISSFVVGSENNIAVATDYSNVVVLNKKLVKIKEFSLTKK